MTLRLPRFPCSTLSDHFRWGSPDYGNARFQSFGPKEKTFLYPTIPGKAPPSTHPTPTPPPISGYSCCVSDTEKAPLKEKWPPRTLLRPESRPALSPRPHPSPSTPGSRKTSPTCVETENVAEEMAHSGDTSAARRRRRGEAAVAAAADADGVATVTKWAQEQWHASASGDAGLSSGSEIRKSVSVAHALGREPGSRWIRREGEGSG